MNENIYRSTHGDIEDLTKEDSLDFSIFRNDERSRFWDRFYPHKLKDWKKKKPLPSWVNPDRRVESEFRSKWRGVILFKFNGRCARCGEYNIANHCHHIKNKSQHPKLRYKADNGILFCKKCHDKFHSTYGYQNNNLTQIINYLCGGITGGFTSSSKRG